MRPKLLKKKRVSQRSKQEPNSPAKKTGRQGNKTHTAFVREPHLALDPHGRRSLLGHPNVRRRAGDRVIIPHGGHLAVLLRRLDIRDRVRAGVPRRTAGFLWELGERGGGEGGEEIRHGVPGATDERLVGAAGGAGGRG